MTLEIGIFLLHHPFLTLLIWSACAAVVGFMVGSIIYFGMGD